MKKLLILLSFLALTITAGAESPYEVFGHKGITLESKLEKGGGIIELINTDTTSDIGRLLFDFKNMKYTAYGWDNNEIASGEILPTVSKRWWSRDPKASEFPDKAPYIFVSCNPINRIDPTGEADYNIQQVDDKGEPLQISMENELVLSDGIDDGLSYYVDHNTYANATYSPDPGFEGPTFIDFKQIKKTSFLNPNCDTRSLILTNHFTWTFGEAGSIGGRDLFIYGGRNKIGRAHV